MSWNRATRNLVLLVMVVSSTVLMYFDRMSGEVYAAIVMGILALFHKGMEDM